MAVKKPTESLPSKSSKMSPIGNLFLENILGSEILDRKRKYTKHFTLLN